MGVSEGMSEAERASTREFEDKRVAAKANTDRLTIIFSEWFEANKNLENEGQDAKAKSRLVGGSSATLLPTKRSRWLSCPLIRSSMLIGALLFKL